MTDPEDTSPAPDATKSASPPPVSPGMLGRYRLLYRLGMGGMGDVWLAEQTAPIQRPVAVKVIKPGMDSAQIVARFEAERQALALMSHPTIAAVFDGGMTPEGRLYFAMEYVKGEPITIYCDLHRLSTSDRLRLLADVCDGVQHAHQKGVIHRDLKPSNVLVTVVDGRVLPKIIDFGLAKAIAQPLTARALFTELGVMIGTPEYMSPEQAEMGALDIDTRTDVYALGVMLYELLTGSLPFDPAVLREGGLDAMRRLIRQSDPPRPSTRVTEIGAKSSQAAHDRATEPGRLAKLLRGDLDWITMKALEKDRMRRYGSVSDLAADLRRYLRHEPVLAGPPSAAYRVRKFVRRHRGGVAAGLAALLLFAAAGASTAFQARRLAVERDIASRERDRAESVSTFLASLFEASDPDKAKGEQMTAPQLLDRGRQRLALELADQPQTRASLLHTIGRVYSLLGRTDEAETVLNEALALRRPLTGAPDADLAETLSELGQIYTGRGDLPRAEATHRDVLQIRRAVFGDDHVQVARTLGHLGTVAYYQGRQADSERYYRESAAMARRVGHLDVAAAAQANLGGTFFAQGRLGDAIVELREALPLLQQSFGLENSRTLGAMNNLASLLTKAGQYAEAEPMQRDILRIRRKVLGPQHLQVAIALYNLGDTLEGLGRFQEAESMLRESVAIHDKVQGQPDMQHGWALVALGLVVRELGRHHEAEALYRRGITMFEQAGNTLPGTAAYGWDGLSEVLFQRGLLDEAEKALRTALEVRHAAKEGPGHGLAETKELLGRVLCARGPSEEGERYAREALAIRRQDTSSSPWRKGALAEAVLGRCLTAAKQYAAAEPLLTGAHAALASRPGPIRDEIRETAALLASLYDAWGKPQQAADWRGRAK